MADLSEDEELELLELENENAKTAQNAAAPSAPPPPPGTAQKVAQVLTSPIRGFRGLGVAAERLVAKGFNESPVARFLTTQKEPGAEAAIPPQPETQSLSQIAERAAEATKPGYVPKPGEKLGSFAGEAVATAPIAAATGGGNLLAQSLKGAVSAGALTAVMEASERGDVEPVDVVASSALGGTIPLIAPTLRTVARAIRGGSKVAATGGTTLAKDAAEELLDDPTLLEKYRGTAESVGERVKDVQKALIKQHEEAGAILQEARAKIGFRETFEDSMARVEREGFKPTNVQDVLNGFKLLSEDTITPDMVKNARAGTMGDIAKENIAEIGKLGKKGAKLSNDARLRGLIRLRESVDDLINYRQAGADVPQISTKDQHFLKTLRTKVNTIIEDVPGGKALREADDIYHQSRLLYDDFQKQIATQGKAEDLIRRVLKGGDIEDAIGRKGEYVRLLKAIEQKKGQALIEPARKELAAHSFRTMEARSASGVPAAAMGPEGVASFLLGSNWAAKVPDAVAAPLGAPGETTPLRALLQAGAGNLPRRKERR